MNESRLKSPNNLAISYVRIEADVLSRKDLSSTEKIILGLVQSFDGKGLMLPNNEIGNIVGVRADTVSAIIAGLQAKGLVCCANPQSKYRRVYFGENPKVKDVLLRDKAQSKNNSTLGNNRPTLGNNRPTLGKIPNITKGTKETKGVSSEKQPLALVLPDNLNTPAFIAAWTDWQTYHREIKKPLTPTTARAQLIKLAKAGPDTAAAMIRQSIEQGWTGLFPIKDKPAPAEKEFTPGSIDRDGLAVCGEVSEALARKVLGWQER
jgi:hypothetical protein